MTKFNTALFKEELKRIENFSAQLLKLTEKVKGQGAFSTDDSELLTLIGADLLFTGKTLSLRDILK